MASGMTVNLAAPHVPPLLTPIRGCGHTLRHVTLSMSQALWFGIPCSRQRKKGAARLQVRLSVLLPSSLMLPSGAVFSAMGRRAGERLSWAMICGGLCGRKEHTTGRQGNRSLPAYPFQELSHLERVSMSLLHMWPPAAASRKAGWGRTHLTVLGLSLGLLQPPSCFIASSGWYSRECASISGTLPSCQPCIFSLYPSPSEADIYTCTCLCGLSLENSIRSAAPQR